MQLVSAELFSQAHGLVQSSGTNKEPQSLSGNPAASSAKANSVNKGKLAATSPKAVGVDKQKAAVAPPKTSGMSKQKSAVASPKASGMSKQKSAVASPKGSAMSKRTSAVASPKASSASKQKIDRLDQQEEGQTLNTKATTPEKKLSRLERKLPASKRKDRDEDNQFGTSLSPVKRQRGGMPASQQRGKASKASKKAQSSKAIGKKTAATDKEKGKKKEVATEAAAKGGGRRGVNPASKSIEKKEGALVGKRKGGSAKRGNKEDSKPHSLDSPLQKASQAQKLASPSMSKAAEQTPKKRYKCCQKSEANPQFFLVHNL